MPRLRKPPVEADDTEIEDRSPPPEDGITIELEGAADDGVTIDLEPDKTPEPEKQPEPDENPMARAVEATARAEGLQRQLAETQRQRDLAVQQTRERDHELTRERGDRQQAEYDSVLNAIGAAQSAADNAQSAYETALATQDFKAAGDAQRRLARAEAGLVSLEDRKAFLDQNREKQPPQPEPRPQPQQPVQRSVEERIQAVPNGDAQSWLRKHPEFVTDQSKNRQISAAHDYLVNVKGVAQFTPAYFEALDGEFGFNKAAPQSPPPPPPPAQHSRSIPVSAPVSRDVPGSNGQRVNRQMHLTKEEVDIARKSRTDLTFAQAERLYAQNKEKLAKMRANGSYPQSERN